MFPTHLSSISRFKHLKGGVFNGLYIRKLIKGENFTSHMTTLEVNAWNAFVGLVQNFMVNVEC